MNDNDHQHDDAAELDAEWFARARPATEVFAEQFGAGAAAEFVKRRSGQRGSGTRPRKAAIAIRLDPDVVAAFKADGPGWQSRINAALRTAARLG